VKGEGCRIHVAGYMMQDTGYRIQEKMNIPKYG
jgi:hypothetical protein